MDSGTCGTSGDWTHVALGAANACHVSSVAIAAWDFDTKTYCRLMTNEVCPDSPTVEALLPEMPRAEALLPDRL